MRIITLMAALALPIAAHAEDPATLIEGAVQSYAASTSCAEIASPEFKVLRATGKALLLRASVSDPQAGVKFDAALQERDVWALTNPGQRMVWCAGMLKMIEEAK